MSRETFLERNGRRCAGPECGRLYEGPEPYCAECRRQVYAAHIGPDGPYFVAEVGEEWPEELGGPQCPSCGGPWQHRETGEPIREADHHDPEVAEPAPYRLTPALRGYVRWLAVCPSCDAEYEVGRAPTARVVF